MNEFNPFLLIIARESREKSQGDLASAIKIDQAHLSRIEQGIITSPSLSIIEAISKELNYPISFFQQKDSISPINDFFYRKKISLPAKEKNKLEARISILRMIFDKLTKSLDIPKPNIPNLAVNANFTASHIANLTREYFGIKRGPIKNLINVLEKNGISVLYMDCDSQKFDAITVYTEQNSPLIILNKSMPNDRKRFSLAHELGHQIMHLPFRFDFEIYERIKSDSQKLEKEADQFASEFLIPSMECKNELINLTYQKLSSLKLYWNVSKRAIVVKAKNLGLINDDKYKNLMIELSRRGERVKESFDVDIDEPKIFNQLINLHKNALNYSISEISNIVNLNYDDLNNYIKENDNSKLRVVI